MRVVIAPDSFKGSLSAWEAAEAMAAGVRRLWPQAETVLVPMADGGEGTTEALVRATGGRLQEKTVTGPLGEPVRAGFGILGDGETGVIEMAAAAGLYLVPEERRDPRVTTTYGVGELIRAALDAGCRRLVVGIGGSATNDGGVGMAQALGARFTDAAGREIGRGGGSLGELAHIDLTGLDPRLKAVAVRVACDVDNPLCGPRGAAAVYGPQKGATPEMVATLDANLSHLAKVIAQDLGRSVADIPGAGAAGGLGAGLIAFLDASLMAGVEMVIQAVNLPARVAGADLVLTGEGKIDAQTAFGKTPAGVARVAKAAGLPVIAVAGGIGDDVEPVYSCGIDALYPLTPYPLALGEAMRRGGELLALATERALRLVAVGRKLG
ncbi:glycerate kinase [Gelria sp. Kuro-4]|uniref:glycerate kinase n=1 Tax=Gelria sp. Kuro-4 TaxID=2796927 RepID=UPI001BF06A7A|nr:glycerate kinase [Gelria sp. Kuro-4]BCV24665.1 glycerate kinase [Gelria sp. Kuro-4]